MNSEYCINEKYFLIPFSLFNIFYHIYINIVKKISDDLNLKSMYYSKIIIISWTLFETLAYNLVYNE